MKKQDTQPEGWDGDWKGWTRTFRTETDSSKDDQPEVVTIRFSI